MALRAFQTPNSCVDGHAINDNFVVIYNREIVQVDELNKDIEIFDVNVHHFFAKTISKGGGNDHAMHNLSLDTVIKHNEQIFKDRFCQELKHIIVWTDNPPHQCRCRQGFIKVLSVLAQHSGINMIHHLAVLENFKGVHGVVDKDPTFLVRNLELMGTRSYYYAP